MNGGNGESADGGGNSALALYTGDVTWLKVGLFLLLVTALLWEGSSLAGGIAALPAWYFGAALVAAFAVSVGFQLVERATPQRPRWRRLLFKWGGVALLLMILSAPHKALQLVEFTGFEFVGRLVASLVVPPLILLVLIGMAILMDGARE